MDNYGAREIYFVDELFTINRKNLIEFCQELLRRKIKIGWKCCSRVDTVDEEVLSLMKKRSITSGILVRWSG